MSPRGGPPRGPLTAAALVAALLAVHGGCTAPPASSASAVPGTEAAPAPTADEIVERYVTARGGIERLRALQTLRQEGHVIKGPGRKELVTREIKRPGKIRFEFTNQGVTSVLASDGQHGWKVSPLEGEKGPRPLPDDVLVDTREQGDIDGPLVDWKNKGSQVEFVGREAVDGLDTYKLKLTLKSGGVLTAYVDVKSANLVRTEGTRQVRGKQVRIETTFTDYRKTDGILFSHLVEVRATGRPQVIRVVLDKVEVNPPLSDARFAPPS